MQAIMKDMQKNIRHALTGPFDPKAVKHLHTCAQTLSFMSIALDKKRKLICMHENQAKELLDQLLDELCTKGPERKQICERIRSRVGLMETGQFDTHNDVTTMWTEEIGPTINEMLPTITLSRSLKAKYKLINDYYTYIATCKLLSTHHKQS